MEMRRVNSFLTRRSNYGRDREKNDKKDKKGKKGKKGKKAEKAKTRTEEAARKLSNRRGEKKRKYDFTRALEKTARTRPERVPVTKQPKTAASRRCPRGPTTN